MKWITPSKKERNTVRNFFGGLCLWKDVSADTFSTAVYSIRDDEFKSYLLWSGQDIGVQAQHHLV